MPKPKRKKPKLYKNTRTLKVLTALANGTLEIAALVAEATQTKSVSQMQWRDATGRSIKAPTLDFAKMHAIAEERRAWNRALRTVLDRRETKVVKRKGRWVVELTEDGKKRVLEADMDDLTVTAPKKWDGRWRTVLFDIPVKWSPQRDIFRKRLQELGFYQLQHSVYTIPYPCEDQLDILIQNLGIADFVTFFETDSLGYQESHALFYFNLEPRT